MESYLDTFANIKIARKYFMDNENIREWFNRNNISVMDNIRVIYNMSKHPVLAKWFCHWKFNASAKTFASRELAVKHIKQHGYTDKLLLVHFVELDTYGIYTPEELEAFLKIMIDNINIINHDKYEKKIVLKCNINQFTFDNQKQKMVFRYKDENTLDKLIDDIKSKTKYDVQFIKVDDGNYEITVQKLNNNKDESDKLFKELKHTIDSKLVDNIREKRMMADMPNCLSTALITIDNQGGSCLIDESILAKILELSKTSPINITINNNCNINNIGVVNNGNIGNNNTVNNITAAKVKRQSALDWIKQHPPYNEENVTTYYNRYSEAMQDKKVHNGEFGKIMKNQTEFTQTHNRTGRYWKNLNNIRQ
jgi:hypothetical protein